jgi:23S rRNA pseudouridine2457 synthase
LHFRYLLFHKPFNVLCQFTQASPAKDGIRRGTLAEYIDVPSVYPVGRLDFDSEGLLLLTNDGALQHRLSDPKFAHPRTYWVQVEGEANDTALEPLRRGLRIQDYRTRPALAKVISQPVIAARQPPIRVRLNIPTSWLEITLTEGRNRQVRRMTAAMGLPTLRLVRVAIASLQLADLAAGTWRDLTPAELALTIAPRAPVPRGRSSSSASSPASPSDV